MKSLIPVSLLGAFLCAAVFLPPPAATQNNEAALLAKMIAGLSNAIAPPTEGQKLRLREIGAETTKVLADLNAIIAGPLKKVNEQLSGQPHVK